MSELTITRLTLALIIVFGVIASFYVYLLWAGVILLALWWGREEWRIRHARR
jgi:hypothetical protein